MAELMSTLRVNENDYTIKDAAAWSRIDDLYAIKESLDNKVTSIDSDSTDTEYPSAKCVYDALNASEHFVPITRGVTTAAEISTILADGKIPYFYLPDPNYGRDKIYYLVNVLANQFIFCSLNFTSGLLCYGEIMTRSTNSWQSYIWTNVTTIGSSATNSQLPTAKAVYDFVTNARKLYRHNIELGWDPGLGITQKTYVQILSPSNSALNASDLASYLYNQCAGQWIPATGNSIDGGMNPIFTTGIKSSAGTMIDFYGFSSTGSYGTNGFPIANLVATDTIVEAQ